MPKRNQKGLEWRQRHQSIQPSIHSIHPSSHRKSGIHPSNDSFHASLSSHCDFDIFQRCFNGMLITILWSQLGLFSWLFPFPFEFPNPNPNPNPNRTVFQCPSSITVGLLSALELFRWHVSSTHCGSMYLRSNPSLNGSHSRPKQMMIDLLGQTFAGVRAFFFLFFVC